LRLGKSNAAATLHQPAAQLGYLGRLAAAAALGAPQDSVPSTGDGARVPIVVRHERLDHFAGAFEFGDTWVAVCAVPQKVGDLLLLRECQPVRLAPCDSVQVIAHAPQEIDGSQGVPLQRFVDDAEVDQLL
jgi:hypothetical protein